MTKPAEDPKVAQSMAEAEAAESAAPAGSIQAPGEEIGGGAGSGWARFWEWLTTPTPDRPLDSYSDHPLVAVDAQWNRRAVRAGEGLLGNLNLAVVDMVIALFEYLSWRRGQAAGGAATGGSGTAK